MVRDKQVIIIHDTFFLADFSVAENYKEHPNLSDEVYPNITQQSLNSVMLTNNVWLAKELTTSLVDRDEDYIQLFIKRLKAMFGNDAVQIKTFKAVPENC